MIGFLKKLLGGGEPADPRDGKTGNQWTSADFPGKSSPLVKQGADELVAFFVAAGSLELNGDGADKLQEIVGKYRAEDMDDYSHFAVVVKEKLIQHGLLPADDPQRYQYSLEHLAVIYHGMADE